MTPPVQHERVLPWDDPLRAAAGLARADGLAALVSDGGELGRWSYVAAEPDVRVVRDADAGDLALLDEPRFGRQTVALLSYDLGARPATGARPRVWPDLIVLRYPSLLAFDHHAREVRAFGLGRDAAEAEARADRAAAWLGKARDVEPPAPPAARFDADAPPGAYRGAVADVVRRIGAGELFQANIARSWSGLLNRGADPVDVFLRLADRRAAYGALLRLGDLALVSNSPEQFLAFDPASRRVESRPIKGTRARQADPARDRAEAEALSASAKDRAENLMIVDLMRNDLARVCAPGSVEVERLFEVQSHPTVHHLVSTVAGQARAGVDAAVLMEAAFPPGSITGAPKHQAMRVIARHEPPRGAWCGSLMVRDGRGRLSASVLIRTATFERRDGVWSFRALAGAGVVADSDPAAELQETEAKIAALREALTGARA